MTIASAFRIKFAKGTALKFAFSIAVLAVLAAGGLTLHEVTREPASLEEVEKAAAKGDASAMNTLGEHYYSDNHDFAKAREWWEKAAAKGNATAMFNLGWVYNFGEGVTQDRAKAREWYEKAAAKGAPNAKEYLERLPTSQPAGGQR